MVETLHPGVYVIEEPATPSIVGVGITTAGFVGAAEKGRVDTLRLVTSLKQYQDEFGGFFKLSGAYTYMAFAVRAFFNEGGTSCFVVRVVPTDAATATISIPAYDDLDEGVLSPDSASNVTALSAGEWGNKVAVSCLKRAPMIIKSQTAGSITVDSVVGIERGDVLYFKGETNYFGVVQEIDTSTADPTITLADSDVQLSPEDVSTEVLCSTQHRFRTKLYEACSVTASTIKVSKGSTLNLVPGQLICVVGIDSDSPTQRGASFGLVSSTVRGLNYDTINFTAALDPINTNAASDYAADGTETVTSIEFHVNVYEDNFLRETHQFLSMSRDNARDFVGGLATAATAGRLYGAANESVRIELESLATYNATTDASNLALYTPLTDDRVTLVGGADGGSAALTSTVLNAGITLFDDIEEVSMVACPDGNGDATVMGHLVDRAEASLTRIAVVDPSLANSEGSTAVQDVLDWRQNTLNKDSSYGALYWPWLVVSDPAFSGLNAIDPGAFSQEFGTPIVKIPASGHAMGEYAATTFARGVHKAPANVTLSGVIDVTKRIGDAAHDFLNPKGINAIRFFPGQGIRIFGARTLHQVADGKHYVNVRRLLIYIERSIKEGNRFAVFEPNDPVLYEVLRQVNGGFLRSLWE